MDAQRLHTEMDHVYQDLERLTGMGVILTHMIPNAMRAIEPWLKEKVIDPRYWDGEYDPEHLGEHPISPMNKVEQAKMLERYKALPHPKLSKNHKDQQ